MISHVSSYPLVPSTRKTSREQKRMEEADEDVAHSYQYSFAPNPHWSNLYAPGSEIQKYLEDVATKFGATRFIKTNHEVKRCEWDDVAKLWLVSPFSPSSFFPSPLTLLLFPPPLLGSQEN